MEQQLQEQLEHQMDLVVLEAQEEFQVLMEHPQLDLEEVEVDPKVDLVERVEMVVVEQELVLVQQQEQQQQLILVVAVEE